MAGAGAPEAARLAAALRAGDRRALGQAITLVESAHPADRATANQLLAALGPGDGRSVRVGISGVPGVGKSTFIEALGNHVIDAGHRVAVLAVDPSSALSGGSILGDKTRMERLSRRLEAFIRPSPAGRTLGGVTRHTRETIAIVEAAGFDVVIVETVGVGQSETAVAAMTDLFLLLLLPGAGDELQGIKRGIVELADIVVVNKADGELTAAAGRAAADYRNALHLLRARSPHWQVPVETVSALEGRGIDRIWQLVNDYCAARRAAGEFTRNRAEQAREWLRSETAANLLALLDEDPALAARLAELEADVAAGHVPPRVAADELTARLRRQLAATGGT
ncbi:MAG: methylmalonyl Co-A mutase-associated GTPase MeaB [Chromatiales bacterium]|jgi:LAO/AO transport system kinase|nr:methylmalonyl Co-A mutase-associated GTPase MeaB [Chromatiales bacterium]